MEKVKDYLKDKGIGIYATLGAIVVVFATLLVYLITVNNAFCDKIQSDDFRVSVAILLSLGIVGAIGLLVGSFLIKSSGSKLELENPDISRTMAALAPWLIFACVLISFVIYANSVYTVYIKLAPGRVGLEPISDAKLFISLTFFLISFFVSIVPVVLPVLNKDLAESGNDAPATMTEVESNG